MNRFRNEWLVWQLMSAWGFDQVAAEIWMEQNFEEALAAPRLREVPLLWDSCREKIAGQHKSIEERLTDKSSAQVECLAAGMSPTRSMRSG